MQSRLKSVVVVGGGSAGFLAALAFRGFLPDVKVTVVRAPDQPPIGVGESTTPVMPRFLHEELKLDKRTFYEEVRPTWKLGVRLDWCAPERGHFYYPFDSPMGEQHAGPARADAFLHLGAPRVASPFTNLADGHRSTMRRNAEGRLEIDQSFAYHIENRPFIAYLERQAINRGVYVREARFRGVERAENGDVACLVMGDGSKLAADLFVDCSGFRSELLERVMGEPFIDYSASLFNDRAVVGTFERRAGIRSATGADMMNFGWCWRIELMDRVNRGYVFSSRFCSDEAAAAELLQRNPEMKEPGPVIKFRTGRHRRFWVGNVVGVGNSSGFVEPLEATGLHMAIDTIRLMIRVLLDSDTRPDVTHVELANARNAEEWDDVRNFIALHFKLNRRGANTYWETCRNETELHEGGPLLEAFRRCGPASLLARLIAPSSMFGLEGYLNLLIGAGAPTEHRYVPTAEESARFAAYVSLVESLTAQFLPMDEALAAVHHPSWRWPERNEFVWG